MNLAAVALQFGSEPARADHPAFRTAGGGVSNAALQRMVAVLAADLARLGVKAGDKVMFRMTNSVEFAAAFLACVWLGAIPVLQNSQLGRSELAHIVELSDPSLFLLANAMRDDPATAGLRPGAARMIVTGRGLVTTTGQTPPSGQMLAPAAFDADRDAPAFIVFTTGTSRSLATSSSPPANGASSAR
jgi:acyl-coenzyme A synthetase/AMP-(fatty) acid ligase